MEQRLRPDSAGIQEEVSRESLFRGWFPNEICLMCKDLRVKGSNFMHCERRVDVESPAKIHRNSNRGLRIKQDRFGGDLFRRSRAQRYRGLEFSSRARTACRKLVQDKSVSIGAGRSPRFEATSAFTWGSEPSWRGLGVFIVRFCLTPNNQP